MARSSNQKQKILYIEKMFREESDELHALTVAGIQEKLERFGITAERKALYSDIETLRDILGMDICSDRTERIILPPVILSLRNYSCLRTL